jgi:hypothetical protein
VVTGRVTTYGGVATGDALPSSRPKAGTWLVRWVLIAVLCAVGAAWSSPARADPTDSILTYGCDPPLPRTTANCAIWHTSPVNLRWTLVDPNFTPVPGTNCDATSISQDTQGTNITCAVEDAFSTVVQKTVKLRVDQTAPSVSGATPARPADKAGWWNHSVAWLFAGSDATSGLAGCDTVTYSGPDSGSGDVAGSCRDNAGNAATGHVAVKYDATPPSVTGATSARPADKNGWWNHSVNWVFTGSDATSGLSSCDTVTYSGPDSATGDVPGDCRDNAGNAATGHKAIKYDDAPPTLTSPVPGRPPDFGSWWNHPVTIAFAATDATSGIASCDSVAYAGPDNSAADVAGSCRDVAGNVAGTHSTVKYDATPPTITAVTTDRPPDLDGWWNHPVEVALAGSDATSGIAGCDTVTYSGPDVAAHDVAGSCSDRAGNSSTATTAIKYDATAPTITSVSPERPPDYDGWWNHPVKVAFAGTDQLSGLAYCDTIVYSGSDTPSADVTGNCTDRAGNAATGRLEVKYDDQPPVLEPLPPEVGSNQAVVHWSASPDAVLTEVRRSPGIGDTPVSTVYSGTGSAFSDSGVKNDETYTYSIVARDAAANVASVTVALTPREAAPTPVPDSAPVVVPAQGGVPATVPESNGGARAPLPLPRLKWRRVKGATYYNVQLFRGKRKILSAWPRSTQLQLKARWTFRGRVMRLSAGNYRWYVWPGFGKRSARRYGRLLVERRLTWSPSGSAASRHAVTHPSPPQRAKAALARGRLSQ